ncbi:hypothetical protein, partial [Kordiimonas lipolytica]
MNYRHLTLLCGFSALVVSQVAFAFPDVSQIPDARPSGRTSAYVESALFAYFGPEEDEAEDQAEDEAEEEAEEEAEAQAEA